ncbi:MAG: hypothetical protein KC519_19105 [Anaerolineae bacterium]|nr:hypothetical protein [Anaerolineae bacterium]
MLAYPVKTGHIYPQLNTEIIVVPASERYVEQMAALQRLAYGDDDDDIMREEHFASHLRYFPQGQFVALDPETDTVVGTTSGMQIHFSREEKLLESWHVTTGDG